MGEINQSGFDKVRWIKLAALAAAPALLGFAWLQPVRAADPKPVDFNKDIKPLLAQNCLKCHKPDPRDPAAPPPASASMTRPPP